MEWKRGVMKTCTPLIHSCQERHLPWHNSRCRSSDEEAREEQSDASNVAAAELRRLAIQQNTTRRYSCLLWRVAQDWSCALLFLWSIYYLQDPLYGTLVGSCTVERLQSELCFLPQGGPEKW